MSDSKGCGIVVAMVGILALVVLLALGGAAYWLYSTEDSPEWLEGMPTMPGDPVAVEPPTEEPPVAEPATDGPPPSKDGSDYAVLLPLEQTIRVDGPLPKAQVDGKILARRHELRKCYQSALENNADLNGEMSIQFTVAASNGKVTAAVERFTKFTDASAKKCILDEIRSWQFSPQKSQSVVKFDVLMLSPMATQGGAGDSPGYAVMYPLEQSLTIEGSLAEDEVKDRLLSNRYNLRQCYQDGLEKNPGLKGEMSLQFTVAGSNGKVTAAVERRGEFSDASVKKCMLDELRKLKFSPSKGQTVVKFDVLMLSMSASEIQP